MKSFILTYHSIDSSGSVISISPSTFRAHMRALTEGDHPVVSLDEVQNVHGAVALTFDDGFRNFFETALPILDEFGLPATVFAVTGHCGGKNDWATQPHGIPMLDLMGWSELREILRYRVTLGAHTVSHPKLTALDHGCVRDQMARSRTELEDRTGSEVSSFAYPYGDSNGPVRRIAGELFPRACGTAMGYLNAASDPLELPRLDAYYLRNPFWLERAGGSLGSGYIAARQWIRELRQTCGV